MSEKAEQIARQPEVREALEQTRAKKVKARPTDKFWFVTHGLLLIGCAVLYWLVGSKFIPLIQWEVELSHRLIRGAALIIVVLATAKSVKPRSRYTTPRLLCA